MKKQTYLTIFIAGLIAFSCSTESTPVYQLATSADPSEGGTVTQSAPEAEEGENITVTANPNEHWLFDGWQGDLTGQQNPADVLMDRDKNITARFVLRDYPLTIHQVGDGEITEEVVQQRSTEYPYGTSVRLTATASEYWDFEGWSGALSDTSPEIIIEINEPKSVTATFVREEYSLDQSVNGSGSIETELLSGTETENGYLSESEVELTANAEPGWRFVEWDGDLTGSEEVMDLFMDSDKSVTATFEEVFYNVSIETEGSGTATADPQKDSYKYGEMITFNANPSSGNEFLGWSGSFSQTDRSVEIEIKSDIDVKATFSTVEDALVYRFSGGTFINGRVFGASLSLTNRLPEGIVLNKFVLMNANGVELTSAEDNVQVQPGESTGYSISFGIAPTEETFSNYLVAWHVTYKGSSYTKQTRVGFIGSTAKMTNQPDFIRELKIDESKL